MKLLGTTLAALASARIQVDIKLCTDKKQLTNRQLRGVLYAANGAGRSLHITVPKEDGTTVRQTITSGYNVYATGVLTQVLPEGDLGSTGQWTAPWVEFDYTSANVLCLEQLTVSNPDDPSISYNIIQDWDPNAWDVTAADPGWESITGRKITNFAQGCNADPGRQITTTQSFLQSCQDTVRIQLAPVNECEGDNMCDENATCTDTPTSYTCECNPGWTGTGVKLDPSRTSGDTRGCFAPPGPSVDSCNDENGVIELTATLRNVGEYGQDGTTSEITFARADLTPSFETDGGVNYLVMTKVLGGDECTEIVVDGVTVCSQVAEQVTLRCRYSLEDQDLTDDFQVTGQDTTSTAEGVGTLDYTLEVEQNKAIGDEIKFTVTPVNGGLVYATVKSCDVTRGTAALTIVGHGAEHCTNPAVNVKALTALFTSQNEIEGSWTAFKWSTSVSDADAEDQGLTCKIGLSENASTDAVTDCQLSNE